MAVLTDWAEDHEDVKALQAIVDNYALDGVEVDIETQGSSFVGDTYAIVVDGTFIGKTYDNQDIEDAIEAYLETKYLNGVGR